MRPCAALWRGHNALKVAANSALLVALARACCCPAWLLLPVRLFFASALYEAAVDPVALLLTRRSRMLAASTVHHLAVLVWSAINAATVDAKDPPYARLLLPQLALIAGARVLVYGGVFAPRLRPVAVVAMGAQFVGLLGAAAFGLLSNALYLGPLHRYVCASQALFVSGLVLGTACDVGIVLVFRNRAAGRPPVLYPLWVPFWARGAPLVTGTGAARP